MARSCERANRIGSISACAAGVGAIPFDVLTSSGSSNVRRNRVSALLIAGFFDEVIDGKRIVGHGGGFPGINSQLDMYLDNGYTVAIMSNYDPPAAQVVAGKLREMILLF